MGEMRLSDWEQGLPCEEDGLAFCGRCKPKPFELGVIVTDGGSAFHRAGSCEGLIDGQRAADYLGQQVHPTRVVHREVAISKGYLPCLICYPSARGHT